MIKINNDFDLDKLVGFEKFPDGSYLWGNDLAGVLIEKDRRIMVWTDNAFNDQAPFMLYNLFKMGIIEEVRDE